MHQGEEGFLKDILGLAMAIVVIGRGIDISLIAALAVPSGLVLQMVQDGHPLPVSLVAAFALAAAFGLVNGWLIAYAEVPSLFTTLALPNSAPSSAARSKSGQ